MNSQLRALLIEDEFEHAELVKTQLSRHRRNAIKITWAENLTKGLEKLEKNPFDVILLDLGLPDSAPEKTLSTVLQKAKDLPIVVLSSLENEDVAICAVQQGAQDYITKYRLNGELLFRAIHYSLQRKAIEGKLKMEMRAQDEFLATISHELRTPIGIIQGFAEVLPRPDATASEKLCALDAILRNAKLQVRLIEDLLDMSGIIRGQFRLESATVDIIQVLQEALESIALAVNGKKINLVTSFEESARIITGDKVRLHQIIWNLFSNAIKFTPAGGEIRVIHRRIGSMTEITIEDSGEGIDREFLPYVFDRFRQQDSGQRRRFGGMGLGLAIAKYLIDLHGGDIRAASAGPGKGSTFTITLPIGTVRIGSKTAESDGIELNQNISSGLSLGELKVLIVDNDLDMLILMELKLKRRGAIVFVAASTQAARDVLRTVRPDIIICDIGMPEEDGNTFITRLRATEPDNTRIPAIALTAYVRPKERSEALNSGFDTHLPKPIDENKIVDTILRLTSASSKVRN